jgi:hypothetical protein
MVRITLLALVAITAFAMAGPDLQAASGAYGCAGACGAPEVASYDCSGEYGCSGAAASCGGERSVLRGSWYPGRLLVRGTAAVLRGTARVATAPVRAVGALNVHMKPQARVRGRLGGCG